MEHYVVIGESSIWTFINDDIDDSKPYLCLCGGGPGIGDSLTAVNELLKSHFNIIRFEQRGCGRSTKDGNYALITVLSDLEEIRNFYKIKNWFIAGHSWGAGVALFYALNYKSYCNGVIYISGMGIQNDNDWAEEFNKNARALKEPEFVLPQGMEINYDVTNMGLCSYNDYIKQPALLRDISQLMLPVLIICGGKDIRPNWPAIQLANLLPNSQLEILANCNHFPWEQEPDTFKKITVNWLSKKIN